MDDHTDAEDLQTILAEQRRELLAAKTLVSDLDMAFNLQMKEALTASLALQPSSSTPLSPPPSPPFEPKDDLLDLAAAFMLEDVERLPQEYEDHERSVSEVKRLKVDLDRRIHDQKFAIKLRDLPEGYWREYGDEYERPFCTDGSSSSKDESQSECLRLYCKGLISEEVVKKVAVAVAGIGVAICDPRDNLLFEAKKNLEVLTDGEIMSNEAAELEALCEGLNKALALDLKNVTFFCDDNKLYQYVINKVVPGNSKIATLVNQVASLQRKFESCQPSLVAHSDIKFAFKLARDAIVSQISWCVKTSEGKSLKQTCAICFEETDVARMFSVNDCLHRYCISCIKKHVEVKLLSGMVAQCPHEACKCEVNIDNYEQFLAPNLVLLMSQRMKESSIPVTEKVYCSYPKCSALMSNKEVLEYTKTSYVEAEQTGARKCMKCHYYFCINCMVPWHYKMSCEEYRKSHPYPLKEDQLLNSLAATKKWRNCDKCNHMVELAEGCYHITCRCGHQFCYTCGAEWKNKKPTCSCPIWVEHNIIREQPQEVQAIIPDLPQQVHPIIREQPRQVQPFPLEQPRQVLSQKRKRIGRMQPRQVYQRQ